MDLNDTNTQGKQEDESSGREVSQNEPSKLGKTQYNLNIYSSGRFHTTA